MARARLLEEHMGLVRSVAFRYRGLGLPTDDLVQEGAIGLLTAIDEFDSSRDASFSTYAFWRVRGAITHALTARGQLIRVPRPMLEHRRDVARAHDRLSRDGHEPTVKELAEATTLPPRDVVEALALPRVASLDLPTDKGQILGELLPGEMSTLPDVQVVERERAHAVREAVQHLRARKRVIVRRHFGLTGRPDTLNDIARDLNLSPERTRALKNEALRELAAELEPTLNA